MPRPGRLYRWIFAHRVLWLAIIFLSGFVLDQGSKLAIESTLSTEASVLTQHNDGGNLVPIKVTRHRADGELVVVPSLLSFRYAENHAAAFGLLSNVSATLRFLILAAFAAAASLLMGFWYLHINQPDGLLLTSVACIMAGALGNLVDRLRLGYVVDFIDAYLGAMGRAAYTWPTFNFADMLVVGGAVAIIYRSFRPLVEDG